jgi:hypothetical protein
MRKNLATAHSGGVKRDYLIELAAHWYRVDTIEGAICAPCRARAQSSVRSPAKREAIVSRGLT